MFLANFIFVVSHLIKNIPSCSFKHFESSDVIVVKKEKFIESLLAFLILMF